MATHTQDGRERIGATGQKPAGSRPRGANITAAAAAIQVWDTIVIGAGMGGAAATYAMARRGLNVLVIERGHAHPTDSVNPQNDLKSPEDRLRAGRWPKRLSGTVDGRSFDFFAPLGSGVGGSTLLYAAALDRFRPSDFASRPHPAGGAIGWPFTYETLAPFYAEAERLLEVAGTCDPLCPESVDLKPASPLSPRDADLMTRFRAAGLNPYQLHHGVRATRGCKPCLGHICPKACKRHGGNAFLDPAMATGNVAILSDTEVTRFEADRDRVEALHVMHAGTAYRLMARQFVLAAGTYFSPVLLLRSTSAHWPNGLGNHNDQVGRNLMFHTGRSLAVWSTRDKVHQGPGKSLVFRDFYDTEHGKFGEVQSTGAEAAYGNVVYALRQMLATSRFAKLRVLWHLARIPAFVASRLLGKAAIFEAIMEDLPYPENRVVLDPKSPSGMRFQYAVPDELQQRFDVFSALVIRRLKGMRKIWLSHGLALNHGHPMGTCRIGTDPATSVADPDGRVHGVRNLYIGDGSFMPTAGGTNPSLTIAAHGLRLGQTLKVDGRDAAAQDQQTDASRVLARAALVGEVALPVR